MSLFLIARIVVVVVVVVLGLMLGSLTSASGQKTSSFSTPHITVL